jgi:hypothetical protein
VAPVPGALVMPRAGRQTAAMQSKPPRSKPSRTGPGVTGARAAHGADPRQRAAHAVAAARRSPAVTVSIRNGWSRQIASFEDVMRGVQALPGVSSASDLHGEFFVRGSDTHANVILLATAFRSRFRSTSSA